MTAVPNRQTAKEQAYGFWKDKESESRIATKSVISGPKKTATIPPARQHRPVSRSLQGISPVNTNLEFWNKMTNDTINKPPRPKRPPTTGTGEHSRDTSRDSAKIDREVVESIEKQVTKEDIAITLEPKEEIQQEVQTIQEKTTVIPGPLSSTLVPPPKFKAGRNKSPAEKKRLSGIHSDTVSYPNDKKVPDEQQQPRPESVTKKKEEQPRPQSVTKKKDEPLKPENVTKKKEEQPRPESVNRKTTSQESTKKTDVVKSEAATKSTISRPASKISHSKPKNSPNKTQEKKTPTKKVEEEITKNAELIVINDTKDTLEPQKQPEVIIKEENIEKENQKDEEILKLKGENANLLKKVADLEENIQRITQENEQLQLQLKNARAEKMSMEEMMEGNSLDNEVKLETLQKRIATLEKSLEAFQKDDEYQSFVENLHRRASDTDVPRSDLVSSADTSDKEEKGNSVGSASASLSKKFKKHGSLHQLSQLFIKSESREKAVAQAAQNVKDSPKKKVLNKQIQSQVEVDVTVDENKVSLESITKADKIKEQLSSKYSNFATLRRNQIEMMQSRKASAPPSPRSPKSSKIGRSKTIGDVVDLETVDGGKRDWRRSKEALSVLLNSRQPKNSLVQKGIIQGKLFGTPLENLAQEKGIPSFLLHATDFLALKSLSSDVFSVQVDQIKIDALKSLIEAGQVDYTGTDPSVVGAVIKQFFFDLPEPVIPFTQFNVFSLWTEIDDSKRQLTSIRSLIHSLPPNNRQLLNHMVSFFRRACNDSQGQLTSSSIASAFGPLFLRYLSSPKNDDYLKKLERLLDSKAPNIPNQKSGEILLQFLIDNEKIIAMEEGIKYVMKEGNQIISSATVDKLFEKLSDEYFNEPDFTDVFLLTHPYFIPSVELLKRLLKEYNKEVLRPWQKRVQARVLRILKMWIGNYSGILRKDNDFKFVFNEFIQQDASSRQEQIFVKFLAISEESSDPPAGDSPFIPALDVLDFEPYVISLQLTHIDHGLFKVIQPYEFMRKAFVDPNKAPNFTAIAEEWNKRSCWVSSEIVKREKTKTRTAAITHFIKIAEMCNGLNNFHGCYAIVAGLAHSSVSRLEKSWNKVPKRTMQTYQTLLDLFDMSYNYKNYRTNLQTSSPPIIPYMGLYPKDITNLEEAPTFLEDGTVNFGKLRDLWRIVNQMRPLQNSKYRVDVNPELRSFLEHPKFLSDKELFEVSVINEPPKKKKVPVRPPSTPDKDEPLEYRRQTSTGSATESMDNIDRKKDSLERKGVVFRNTVEESSLTDTSDASEDESSDDVLSARLPSSLATSINHDDFRNSINPEVRESRSSSLDSVSKRPFMSPSEKAAVIKDLFGQKYTQNGTLRRDQLEKLAKGRGGRTEALIQRQQIAEMFSSSGGESP